MRAFLQGLALPGLAFSSPSRWMVAIFQQLYVAALRAAMRLPDTSTRLVVPRNYLKLRSCCLETCFAPRTSIDGNSCSNSSRDVSNGVFREEGSWFLLASVLQAAS